MHNQSPPTPPRAISSFSTNLTLYVYKECDAFKHWLIAEKIAHSSKKKYKTVSIAYIIYPAHIIANGDTMTCVKCNTS